uniref:Reverse transcriptase/retrotransposon-derived protein RNase H-like domain-containing protein n=1 Tax=Sphaeramia orbicularis TaxID=375764 RepID=A0A672YQ31_9TELE
RPGQGVASASSGRSADEPNIPPPNKYAGDPETCRNFFTQLQVIFEAQPRRFSCDAAKIAYVARFLGFANFYRKFIRGFSNVAAPLHALTSLKTTFRWSPEAEEAF